MKKYKIAMIGHGGFGRFCTENYQAMENVEVAAVAGSDATEVEKFAKEFNIPFFTTDYKEILARPEIDVVAIMTPPNLHCEMAVAAAQAGKAFLVEKPLALSLEEADQMIAAAKDNKVPATIGYVMRYTWLYDKAREIAKSGKLGKLKRMVFENYASGHLPDNHWLFNQNLSGGLLVEHGVHFFDIFGSVVGKDFVRAKSWRPTPREVLAVVEYPDDVIATFYHAFDKPGAMEQNGGRFVFEKGYVGVDGWIPMGIKTEYENEAGEIVIEEERVELSKDGYYRELVKDVLADLLAQIDDPNHKPKVTLAEGRESLRLALEARENKIF